MKLVCATLLALSLLTLVPAAGGLAAALLEPLTVGWEQMFKLQWQTDEHRGRTVVSGSILNDSPYSVTRVQLLVEGLDGQGAVVRQDVDWLGEDLTPGTSASFEVSAPGPAPSYRVRVFAFDRLPSDQR